MLQYITTGIIDSKNARFVSRIGKIKKAIAKTISQMRNPYNAAFFMIYPYKLYI